MNKQKKNKTLKSCDCCRNAVRQKVNKRCWLSDVSLCVFTQRCTGRQPWFSFGVFIHVLWIIMTEEEGKNICCCLHDARVLEEAWDEYRGWIWRRTQHRVMSHGLCVWGGCKKKERETPTVTTTLTCKYIHMPSLVSHDEGRGEAVFVVEGAAANRVAHPGDRSVTWKTTGRRSQRNLHIMSTLISPPPPLTNTFMAHGDNDVITHLHATFQNNVLLKNTEEHKEHFFRCWHQVIIYAPEGLMLASSHSQGVCLCIRSRTIAGLSSHEGQVKKRFALCLKEMSF